MPHLTDEQISSANRTDIADFLLSRGVRLKRLSDQYLWEDNNVWIHENEWFSHYEQKGGLAVSFVMKYFDKTFQEAVAELNNESISRYMCETTVKKPSEKLILPKRNDSTYRMYMYLRNNRCIDSDVINFFVKQRTLYEDAEHHNCVFVGTDKNGVPGHCHKRSTLSGFKQTIAGSQAEFSFHYNGNDSIVYVFEAPIDMLAYISMHKENWQKHSYVALCSVSEKALLYQLKTHPQLQNIVLCLDNDAAGQEGNIRIQNRLKELGYSDIHIEVPINKDWDEDLQKQNGINIRKAVPECRTEESGHLSLSL